MVTLVKCSSEYVVWRKHLAHMIEKYNEDCRGDHWSTQEIYIVDEDKGLMYHVGWCMQSSKGDWFLL